MSIKIMVELWDQSTIKGGTLLVALALADKADSDTRECWPGIEGVARRTRLSPRQVIRCIGEMSSIGMLEVSRNGSKLGTNLYVFTPAESWRSDIMSPPDTAPDVTFATERCDISGHSDVTPMSPKPSVYPSVETPDSLKSDLFEEKKQDHIEEQFEKWWKAYPAKPGNPKKPALAKFKTALRSKSVTFDDLMAATEQYALTRKGEDSKFTAMAVTWLNQERWTAHQPTKRGARDQSDPFAGLPPTVAECIRLELDPEERRQQALAYWRNQESAA